MRPRGRVAGRDDVDVAVEQQRAPSAASADATSAGRARQPTDDAPRLGAGDLGAGEVRVGLQLVEGKLPVVDLEPVGGQVGGHGGLGLVLGIGAGLARNPQHPREGRDHVGPLADHLVEHTGAPVDHHAADATVS